MVRSFNLSKFIQDQVFNFNFLGFGECRLHGRRQVKKCGVDTHGEREARAYNGGLGEEPPAGSRGRAPGQGLKTF